MASSRLDRLVTLLDKGSTQLIRNTAASQLGDIQKQNPDNLFALLGRVLPYLQSKSWDTRTAAAKAIGAIVAHALPFDPNEDEVDTKPDAALVRSEDDAALAHASQLRLGELDIAMIMQHGRKLLGSAGKDHELAFVGLTPSERLAKLKTTLRARLGLQGEYLDDDALGSEYLDTALDGPAKTKAASKPTEKLHRRDSSTKQSHQSFTMPATNESNLEESGLSKRQLNQLKRKNKTAAKAGANKMRVVDLSARKPSEPGRGSSSPSPHPIKLNGNGSSHGDTEDEAKFEGYFSIKREASDDETQLVTEFKGETKEEKPLIEPDEDHSTEWPFDVMCDFLAEDLFSPYWETRHGAAIGLREVLRLHGSGAGRVFGKSRVENDRQNSCWLEDMASRLLCVLMLDRFGDYVSDTVVAPIRESVGQTLAVVLTHVSDPVAVSIYDVLQSMIRQKDTGLTLPVWEVCHGGMIGLRYFVAVRKAMLLEDNQIIDGVLSAVTGGLAHHDDDVKSVSAATLVPMASELTKRRPGALNQLMTVIWDCLLDMQDDLSASTGAVMDLLANMCSYPAVLEAMKQNARDDPEQSFDMLVPRLYAFLRHTITSVRLAVVKALATFLTIIDQSFVNWIDWRLVRLLFQNLLVERNEGVLRASFELWQSLINFVMKRPNLDFFISLEPHIEPMLKCATQPVGQARSPIPLDTTLLIKPSGNPMAATLTKSNHHSVDDSHPRKRQKQDGEEMSSRREMHNTDGHMLHGEVDLVGMDTILRTRIACARALGSLVPLQSQRILNESWHLLVPALQSSYSTTRLFSGIVLEELAKNPAQSPSTLTDMTSQVQSCLEADPQAWYSDILLSLQAVRSQCQSLVNAFAIVAQVPRGKLPTLAAVCQGEPGAGSSAFSLADADALVSAEFERLMKLLTPAQRVASTKYLEDAKVSAVRMIEEAHKVKDGRDTTIRAAIGSILISLRQIPKKPGQLIKSVMDSVKIEESVELQARSAAAVADLVDQFIRGTKKGLADRIVSNLTKFSNVDTSETPVFEVNKEYLDIVLSLRKEEDRKDHPDAPKFEREAKEARFMRRGAKEALNKLSVRYGCEWMERLPVLKDLIEIPLNSAADEDASQSMDDTEGQALVDAISVFRTILPMLDADLHAWALALAPMLIKAMRSRLAVVRYIAAKAFATLCSVIPVQGMAMLVEKVMPDISNPLDVHDRQGITECVYHLIQVMGDDILPYLIFLIVPVLGRMSDANEDIRLLATTSFATLVKLVPLEAGIPDPPGMPEKLLEGRERERKFMAQMLDPKKVEPFELPVAIKADLRPYQQDGVNWLAFLNRFNLHGILCDDMGLGKTLQTLCIVASDHHMRAEEYAKTQSPDKRRLPSIIVCPTSLTGHWQQEIAQFAPFLTCVAYAGSTAERSTRRHLLDSADIVITTYDICRNDNEVLAPITWNYCVLDEGHLIKNPKTKTTIAVKTLISNHRLILSGTPIQNNVLELWSLFDFLMPGFLGTEKVFQDRFAKPIAASRNAKSSSKEQEAGALAIEGLHKQVLPFLLRRLKEEVLSDLPPKILQNYYCDLSDLQRRLFEDFFKKERKTVEASVGSKDKEAKQHIFQALQYMRKLCNSPAFVVKEGTSQYDSVQKQLAASKSNIRDVAHAPKLNALRDLLVDCGIGVTSDNDVSVSNFVSQHRALIFCQMKEMLDMVQTEVLAKLLPGVQYLRLDGSVEATKRQSIVNKFNNDPSYDCLLLTTSVGGLGLNLTGADTVIFVEHDWNPQKDIQAMDRAHRIGQKKVVNVYRLITRGTLEEKILSLQRFKIDVASTVVNQQNAGLGTMETDQILDLFNLNEGAESAADGGAPSGQDADLVDVETGEVKKKGEKGWLNDVGDLWDERQYEEEFNLDSFVQNLQK